MRSKVTVDTDPVVVIADDGRVKALVTDLVATLIDVVMPDFTEVGALIRLMVSSYSTTLLTVVDVLLTALTWPAAVTLGKASNVTVAGCPTATFGASASAKPAMTWRWDRSEMTRNAEELEELLDELDADEPAPAEPAPADPDAAEPDAAEPDAAPAAEPAADPPPAAVVLAEPPPLTVSPTEPLSVVMVPLIGAVSVVSSTTF